MDPVLSSPTNTFDWASGTKIAEGAVNSLLETFPTLKDILDAKVSDLSKLPGIGFSSAQRIRTYALEIAKQSKAVIASADTSVVAGRKLFDHKPTKQELVVSEEPITTNGSNEKKYVLVEIPVDKFYTKRTRILATPATCLECGYDVVMVNKLPAWEELNEFDQLQVRETLKGHMLKFHANASGKRIITEDEMKHTSWEKPEVLKP